MNNFNDTSVDLSVNRVKGFDFELIMDAFIWFNWASMGKRKCHK
jgi:hypothetical protein